MLAKISENARRPKTQIAQRSHPLHLGLHQLSKNCCFRFAYNASLANDAGEQRRQCAVEPPCGFRLK